MISSKCPCCGATIGIQINLWDPDWKNLLEKSSEQALKLAVDALVISKIIENPDTSRPQSTQEDTQK